MPAQYSVKRTSKTLISSPNNILLLRLIFGHYYDVSAYKIICWLARLYCTVVGITSHLILFYTIYVTNQRIKMTPLILILEVVSNIVVSIISAETGFIEFTSILYSACVYEYKVPQSNYVLYLTLMIALSGRFLVHAIVYSQDVFHSELWLFSYAYIACCVAYLTTIFATDACRKNVHVIKNELKVSFNKNNTSEDEKISQVKYFIEIYKTLTQGVAVTWNVTRARIILGLIFWNMKLAAAIGSTISMPWTIAFLPWDVSTAVTQLFTCTPIILLELMAYDLDEIKTLFAHELIRNKNKRLRATLHDALDYMDAVSERHTMWHMFPMSVQTLLALFNSCVSYIIVLLQFSY